MDQTSDRPHWRWGELGLDQWIVLAVLAGLLLAIGASLVLVIRAGRLADKPETPLAETESRSPGAWRSAMPTAEGLYWPPDPLPLATPDAPGDLIWWDARFAYRRAVRLDTAAALAPEGTLARVIVDGERAQREGGMRADAADLRTLVWDGQHWFEIPRRVHPLPGTTVWEVVFQLQGPELVSLVGDAHRVYHIYYGHPSAGSPPTAGGEFETCSLLLELADQEDVEWGPEVVWQAGALTVQTLTSPDGRVVIQVQPGALQEDTRVRLRTVPLSERGGHGPLPDFELHTDPPPGSPGPDNVARWNPPLQVTINWTGLEVNPLYLETWSHFAYDTSEGLWRSVPVKYDPERGVIRFTTDQL